MEEMEQPEKKVIIRGKGIHNKWKWSTIIVSILSVIIISVLVISCIQLVKISQKIILMEQCKDLVEVRCRAERRRPVNLAKRQIVQTIVLTLEQVIVLQAATEPFNICEPSRNHHFRGLFPIFKKSYGIIAPFFCHFIVIWK